MYHLATVYTSSQADRPTVSCQWLVILRAAVLLANKKAVLSQRVPRDARYIWLHLTSLSRTRVKLNSIFPHL